MTVQTNNKQKELEKEPLHFVVVVLGDVGRSPRMQYHAMSLLGLGDHVRVSLVGYTGEDLIDDLQKMTTASGSGSRLDVIRFQIPTPSILLRLPKPIYLIWRICTMSIWLLFSLLVRINSDYVDCILVQNPPALPLLFIALLFTRIKGWTQPQKKNRTQRQSRPRFIIDWHNLGYSMLPDGSPFQRLAKIYELKLAPYADGHFTVTKAMKSFLEQNTQIMMMRNSNNNNNNNNNNPSPSINVLYDCPPAMFSPLELSEQHRIMQKLHKELMESIPRSWDLHTLDPSKETILTKATTNNKKITSSSSKDGGDINVNIHSEEEDDDNDSNDDTNLKIVVESRRGRPALVTSSTSWTPDEDFGVLLNAVTKLDERIQQNHSTLKVLVVVTGKGPQKAMYQEKISKLLLRSVAIQTVWLEPGDYPKLLACADLGVSLHTSTSGLDLPMKVLDLAGCQVPVCAVGFDCLEELVRDKQNGRIFQTESQLADQLWELLSPLVGAASSFSSSSSSSCHSYGDLAVYSNNLKGRKRWTENWTENALPILLPTER